MDLVDQRFLARTTISGVLFDQETGTGCVADGTDIDYFGFVVMMRPKVFFQLAAPCQLMDDRVSFMVHRIERGAPIAAPFLSVNIPEPGNTQIDAHIVGHEGRHRMGAVLRYAGNVEIPVHIFPRYGLRARHITTDMLERFRERAVQEETGLAVIGPLFGDVRLMGRVISFNAPTPEAEGTTLPSLRG